MSILKSMSSFVFILCLVGFVYGHAPASIDLAFDRETSTLNISISHMVGKITKHYINKLVVELNNEEIIVQKFNTQYSAAVQKASYIIPGTKPGDVFTVTAHCNISGKKKQILRIEETTEDDKKEE
jgi:hypothetical protein